MRFPSPLPLLLAAAVAFAAPVRAQDAAAEAFQRGYDAFNAGDLRTAEREYLAAHRARPDWADPPFNLGVVYAAQERWAMSGRYFQDAIERMRRYPPLPAEERTRRTNLRDAVNGLMIAGAELFELQDYTGADAVFTWLAAFTPNHRDALYNRALVLYQTQRWADLADLGPRLLALDPLNENVYRLVYSAYRGVMDQLQGDRHMQVREMALALDSARMALPVQVADVTMSPEERRTTVTGRVTGGTLPVGRRVRLLFTLYDAEGRPVGTGTANVRAPRTGETVDFRLVVRTSGPALAWSYEWR